MNKTATFPNNVAAANPCPLNCSVALWQAAGGIFAVGEMPGVCRTCGNFSAGMRFEKWVKDTFTNFDLLVPGEIICEPCAFCFADKNKTLTALLGKDKPQNMRTYSHFVTRNGEWFALSKAEKLKMLKLLRMNPPVVVIADSGKKHLIFRSKIGYWQFEEQTLLPNLPVLEENLALIEKLYRNGFGKAEIQTCRYNQKNILNFGTQRFKEIEDEIKRRRGNAYFDLALFFAQKGDKE